MSFMRARRPISLCLVLTLCFLLPSTWAGSAMFSGKVYQADGTTPRAGVVVALVDGAGEAAFRSHATTEDGTFVIEGAEAGTYRVLVETAEGAFLAPDEFELSEGANLPLAFALKTGTAHAPGYGSGGGANYQQTTGFGSGGGGLPTWGKWLVAGVITAVAIVLISDSGDDADEPTSSPF